MRTHLYGKAEHMRLKDMMGDVDYGPQIQKKEDKPPFTETGEVEPRWGGNASAPKTVEGIRLPTKSEGLLDQHEASKLEVEQYKRGRRSYIDNKPDVRAKILELQKSLNIKAERRVSDLRDHANWLRNFSVQAQQHPGLVAASDTVKLIRYIEEFRYEASDENKKKIDQLVAELQTPEGAAKQVSAALNFASQYDRLAQREVIRTVQKNPDSQAQKEKRIELTPHPALQPKPQPKKQGWFKRMFGGMMNQ